MNYLKWDGTDHAYVDPIIIRRLARENPSRIWLVDGLPTSVQVGKYYAKCLDRFDVSHYRNEAGFSCFLDECAASGVERPSSYSSVFHKNFFSPRVVPSANILLGNRGAPIAGGWEQARSLGTFRQKHYRYDLNSAYLWASTLGLPNMESMRFVHGIQESQPGIYRLILREPSEHAPYPFQTQTDVVATFEDIETYKLQVEHVRGGIVWTDSHPEDHITKVVERWSFGKYVARSYWGRWASQSPLVCQTPKRRWSIGNPSLNLIWANLIISRVKQRIWQSVPDAIHIYVDSVITDRKLRTGVGLGEWRVEQTYLHGLQVDGVGLYRPLEAAA